MRDLLELALSLRVVGVLVLNERVSAQVRQLKRDVLLCELTRMVLESTGLVCLLQLGFSGCGSDLSDRVSDVVQFVAFQRPNSGTDGVHTPKVS